MSTSLIEIAHNDHRLLEPLELFAASKVNCVQAVLMPFLKDEPPETITALMDMTGDLGGGLAGMGYVCGALLGGVMVLSRKAQADNLPAADREESIREFVHQFGKEHGALFCSGIKALAGKENEYQACQILVVETIETVDKYARARRPAVE